jgi:hypothetical protein
MALGSWLNGGGLAADGRPQAVLDGLFHSLADGSAGAAQQDMAAPQAVMHMNVSVTTSIDAATGIKDLLQ